MSLLAEKLQEQRNQLFAMLDRRYALAEEVEILDSQIKPLRSSILALAGASEILDNVVEAQKKKETDPKPEA